MWFAIAFDYEATSEMTSLTCTTKFSEPIDVVDPTKTVGKDLREVSGPIALKGKTGRAFWPGYVITDEKPDPVRSTTVCSFEGKEFLRADFVFEQK